MTKNFSESEIVLAKKVKKWVSNFFKNWVTPIALTMSAFYIFTRIKTRVGIEDTFFIFMVLILVSLRGINQKLAELLG